jgi:hypothetical protein
MKTITWKKKKAMKMFLSGMKEGTICKNLKLNINTLRKWIGYQNLIQFKKNKAIEMNKKCIPADIICEKLNLELDILAIWINEYMKGIQKKRKYQSGRSNWIDGIYKSNVV